MANEGSTKPMVNGFCEKHQPNQAVQYAGCWVCSRDEETEMLREVLRAFGWMKDKEAGWYLAADGDDCPKFYDFHDAIVKALDDYDSLREAHKKAHLYGAGQEAENLRVRGLLQRQWVSVEERLPDMWGPVLGLVKQQEDWHMAIVERCDSDDEGWLWSVCRSSWISISGKNDWADFEADDDYNVTHWMPLPDPPNFPQSSELVSHGAESADIGKLGAADDSGEACPVKCPKCLQGIDSYFEDRVYGRVRISIEPSPRNHPPIFPAADKSGVEMGKVNRVDEYED